MNKDETAPVGTGRWSVCAIQPGASRFDFSDPTYAVECAFAVADDYHEAVITRPDGEEYVLRKVLT